MKRNDEPIIGKGLLVGRFSDFHPMQENQEELLPGCVAMAMAVMMGKGKEGWGPEGNYEGSK